MKKLLLSSLLICLALIDNVIAQSGANQTVLPASYRMAMGYDSEVYQNEQYIVLEDGSIGVYGALYKNDGIDITEITLPGSLRMAQGHNMKVYNNDLYLVLEDGSSGIYGVLYKYDGTSFTQIELPGSFRMNQDHDLEVYNDDLYLVLRDGSIGINGALHKYDGTAFTQINLPGSFSMAQDHDLEVYHNNLHLVLEDGSIGIRGALHKYDGTAFTQINLPGSFSMDRDYKMGVFNCKLYFVLGDGSIGIYGALYEFDDVLPTVITQDLTIELNANEEATISAVQIDNGSVDNCSLASLVLDITTFNSSNLGENTVTLTVTDASGNEASATAIVSVQNNEAPTITCPEDITTTATNAVVNFNNPTVTDNVTSVFPLVSQGMTYIGSNGGKNFFISDQSFSGANAFADAVDRGGFVATINDASQNAFIANALQANSITEAHIGYSDAASEGNFVWQDGSSSTYENWQPGEPNNTDGGEDYVTISAGGSWNDVGARGTGNVRYILQLEQTDGFFIQTNGLDSGSSFPIGVTTNTFEAFDATGNNSSCSFDVTVTDIPTVSTQNIDVELDSSGNATITAASIDDGSSAISGISDFSIDISTFDCSNLGENTVTLTVTSNSGETATGTAIVTVIDNLSPAVVTQNITVELDANGEASVTAAQIDNGSADNCGVDSLVLDVTTFDCSDLGENTVTLTVTDASGNEASATAIVTVEDNTDPIAIATDFSITTYDWNDGPYAFLPDYVNDGSSDNCGIDVIDLARDENSDGIADSGYADRINLTCADVGTTFDYLFRVTDNSGNSTVITRTLTIEDNINPTVLTQNITVQLDATGEASITPVMIDNGSSDDCSVDNLALDVTTFDCSDLGENTVTLTVTDASGNEASATAIVTVVDNIAPTLVLQDVTVELSAEGTVSVDASAFDNGSFDNCGEVTFNTNLVEILSCGSLGLNEVTVTATDASGNQSQNTAILTVEDNIAPSVVTQAFTVELDASGSGTITTADVDNGSADNCSIDNLALDVTSFDCSNLGENTVTLTVTDASGNQASATAIVTVVDNVLPTVVTQAFTVELDASGSATITTADVDNGSADNCSIDNLALDVTTFDCSNLGENTVTLTATDASGNEASTTAIVTVVDVSGPVLVTQDITVNLDENGSVSILPGDVLSSVEDNCTISQNITLSLDQDTFTAIGVYEVSLTSKDASGNSTSTTAEVTVDDTLSIDDNDLNVEIKLYPNPASDNIYFEISNAKIQSISIYDINGRLIKTSDNISINISELSSGIYFAKVEGERMKTFKVLRFIKK